MSSAYLLPLTPPARVKVTQPTEAPVPPSSPACDSGRFYPEGERATSVLFGGELMSPAMCCRRRWQLFDLSLADIPPNRWRGSTKIDLKCIQRSSPAYVCYSGSRNCPDKEKLCDSKMIVEKLKGFGQIRVQTVDTGQAASFWFTIYHTDQILLKTASVKYSMENQFQLFCKAKNETTPPHTHTINCYNIL